MKPAKECNSLEEIRTCIDTIDNEVIALLGKRFGYVKEVVRFKKPDADSIIAKPRYDSVLQKVRDRAVANGLDPDVLEKMYRTCLLYTSIGIAQVGTLGVPELNHDKSVVRARSRHIHFKSCFISSCVVLLVLECPCSMRLAV